MTIARDPVTLPGHVLFGHALSFRRAPLDLLRRAEQIGDVVELRLGLERMVLVTRPESIEELLVTHAGDVRKPKILRVAGRLVLGEALDALDGPAWSERVRVVAPALHKQRIEAYGDLAVRFARRMLDRLPRGESREIDRDLLRLSLAITTKAFVDRDDDGSLDTMAQAITEALDAWSARVTLGLPTPDWLPIPHNVRMRRAMTRIHSFIDASIDERRGATDDRGDVLSMLIGTDNGRAPLGDAALRDELAVMAILGGHQLSLALSWATYLLARHPEAEARLHDEAAALGRPPTTTDLPRLPFATRVMNETLRLYPPFFLLAREARADLTIGGHRIARGATIAVSPWATQRSALYFDEPDAFRPERWEAGRVKRWPRFAYFPFGGGPRLCIANAFVRMQIPLVLATLAQSVRFELDPGHVVRPRAGIALGMERGLRAKVTERATNPAILPAPRATLPPWPRPASISSS